MKTKITKHTIIRDPEGKVLRIIDEEITEETEGEMPAPANPQVIPLPGPFPHYPWESTPKTKKPPWWTEDEQWKTWSDTKSNSSANPPTSSTNYFNALMNPHHEEVEGESPI